MPAGWRLDQEGESLMPLTIVSARPVPVPVRRRQPVFYTVEELAARYRTCTETIHRRVRAGILVAVPGPRGQHLITEESVIEYEKRGQRRGKVQP